MSSNKISIKFFFILLIPFIIIFWISNQFIINKEAMLLDNMYNSTSNSVLNKLQTLIEDKKNTTTALAVAISKDYKIINSLENKQYDSIDLERLSLELRNHTKYKNVWIEIFNESGKREYNSWNDNFTFVENRIESLDEKIDVTEYGLSFLTSLPIFKDEVYLGFLRLSTKFNSIAKELEKENIQVVVLVNEDDSKKIRKPFTNKFFGNSYIANNDVSDETLELLKNYNYDSTKNYNIYKNFLINNFSLNGIANILLIKEIRFVDTKTIESFKTNAYILLVVGMSMLFLFYIIYIDNINFRRVKEFNDELKEKIDEIAHQKDRIKLILDSQSSIIVITDGTEIIDANKQLIEFYKDCKDTEEFKEKYMCICKTFVNLGEDYIVDKTYDNERNWAEYILLNSTKRFKVAIYDENKILKHFSIKVVESKIEKVMIVTLNDITNEINQQQILENVVEEQTHELRLLNESLEIKIKEEIEKSHQKDKIIFQQNKMASMSELLNNIAHHWRQPLSVISCAASGMKLQKEIDLLEDSQFYKNCDLILDKSEYLSKTIDSFSSLFDKESKIEKRNLFNVVNSCYLHLKSILNEDNIEIKIDIDKDIVLEIAENDFKQVIFHLLNNSIKILKERCFDTRKVILIQFKDNKLTIQDNAKGIDENLIDKIFEPYFTTEHGYMGKGLSLFSVKEFLLKPMNLDINVCNSKFIYDEIEYQGLKFTINF